MVGHDSPPLRLLRGRFGWRRVLQIVERRALDHWRGGFQVRDWRRGRTPWRGCGWGFQILTEGVRELRHAWKAVSRGLRHRPLADSIQPRIHVGTELPDRRYRGGHYLAHHN